MSLVGLAAHYALDLPWRESLLLGAIVSSTDAAAVFFLLRVGGIMAFDDVIVPPDLAGVPDGDLMEAGQPAGWADILLPASPGTAQIRELAGVIRGDERLTPLFLPAGEGVLAAVKRS